MTHEKNFKTSILGRLSAAEKLLHDLPNALKACELAVEAVKQVPSVRHSAIYLNSGLNPIGDQIFDEPPLNRRIKLLLNSETSHSRFKDNPDLIRFQLKTKSYEFGFLVIKTDSTDKFKTYFPFIHNFANALSIQMESRYQKDELSQKNKELQTYRNLLEDLINERTAELKQRERILSLTQKQARIGGWEWNVERSTMFWTKEVYRIHGVDPGNLGQFSDDSAGHLAFSLNCYSAEDRPKIEKAFQDCIDRGIAYDLEFEFTPITGNKKWIRTMAEPFIKKGRITKVFGNIMDITDQKTGQEKLKKSKKMLQAVFDGISEPLLLANMDGVVKMMNRSAAEYFNVSIKETINSQECRTTVNGILIPCLDETIINTIRKGEYTTFERDGFFDSERSEQVMIYPIKGQKDPAAIIRIVDITDSKDMERRLIQNEKLVSLGFLTTGVAHEINNPNSFISFNIPILRDYLNGMMPYIDKSIDDKTDTRILGMKYPEFRDDLFKMIDNIEHGSKRINKTVSALKDFSRKKERVEKTRVSLQSIIEKAVMITQGKIRRMVKRFNVEVPDPSFVIETDPEVLEQILINLLINAAQAADKHDARVDLKVIHPEDCDRIIIAVEDNGCGMDDQTLNRIFDPFFTTKKTGEGTGLGLSLCYNLSEAIDAEITVKSVLNQGSVFKVTLKKDD